MSSEPEQIAVDILVIGWGKGGKTLAGAVGRQGRTVALVERSAEMYGGSCINIACVPTKDLVVSAAGRRPEDDPREWFAASVAGRDALVEKLRARNHAMLAEVDAVTLIDGTARFVAAHEVEVAAGDDRLRVRAETIIVNTGTEPVLPPIPGVDGGDRVHDSTSIQHIDPLPEHLAIVGGGYVGLEFADMFAHFGSRVTVIDRGERFMPHDDRDVADAARAMLEEHGVEFRLRTGVDEISDTGDAVEIAVSSGSETDRVTADAVLIAAGRRPVTDDLGLEVAGIVVDDRGFIVVDERLRTSVSGVFAVGDVNGGPQFTYISLDDNRIVMDQLAGGGSRSTADRIAVPSTMFLTPPIARVGIGLDEARERGGMLEASKAVVDIAAMPRPKIVGETHGLIRVLVDAASDRILGATVFSIDAQEVINLIALAMRAEVTATALREGIWTHPSSTEALNEVLAGLRPLDA